MSVVPIAVSLSGGPFCGAGGVVALQAKEQLFYLIRDAVTHQVYAYQWADRTEEVAGVPKGWVLEYVCYVGSPAAVTPGVPLLPGFAEYVPAAESGEEVQP